MIPLMKSSTLSVNCSQSCLTYLILKSVTILHGVINAYPKGVPKSLGIFQEAKLNRGAQH
jgi:hypothetical protein